MSPIHRHTLSLINRNLQLTLGGGVVLFILGRLTDCKELFATLSASDAMLMIALVGLPLMLSFFGNAFRPRTERAVARLTASTICLIVAVHAWVASSQNLILLLAVAGIVMAQVTIMRKLQAKGTA